MMRDRVERFAVLPFSIGCSSHSSVAVATKDEFKKPKSHSFESVTNEKLCGDKMKEASGMVDSTKTSNITDGIYRLIRSFKSFSQLFIGYKEEMEETTEAEMEIGLPTDVKHVTHVGLDGTMTGSNAVRGWENLCSQEITSLPSFPFGPLELAALTSHSNQTSSVP